MLIADASTWTRHDLTVGTVWWKSSIGDIAPVDVDTNSVSDWATEQRGNWGAIIHTRDDAWWILTDAVRSFPILFSYDRDHWVVASHPDALTEAVSTPMTRRDHVARYFRHSGYTWGRDTLLNGVLTLEPGAALALDDTRGEAGEATIHSPNFSTETIDLDADELQDRFYDLVCERFADLVEDSRGSQLLIPLSGGADSRLVASALREIDAPNVLAFTYGIPGGAESSISKRVADAFDIPWIFVDLDGEEMTTRWCSHSTTQFLRDTWCADSLPHIQDWYALKVLRQRAEVDPHGIVVPGHTVVGNAHGWPATDPHAPLDREGMVAILAAHHGALQGRPDEFAAAARDELLASVDELWDAGNPDFRWRITAAINVRNRQVKYISNSVRSYEHAGFRWALPMQERPMWEWWNRAPHAADPDDRAPYIAMINRKTESVIGDSMYYRGPAEGVTGVRAVVKNLLIATHLDAAAKRAYTVHAQLKHPMGFQFLLPPAAQRGLWRELARGRTLLGIYADLFLANEWVPGSDSVVP